MKKVHLYLIAILIIAFSIRVVPYFWENRPIGLDSYYHMRMAENVGSYDSLSYGGRPYTYPPGIHLFLSLMPQLLMPFIITLIGSLIILSIFLITREIYGEKAGLIASLFIAFIPVHIWKSASNMLVTAIDITMLSLAFYFLIKKKFLHYFAISALIFIFSPAISILSLLLYIPFAKKDKKSAVFLAFILIETVAAFAFYGSAIIIYTNALPYDISSALYENIGIIDIFYRLSPFIIPLALYGMYLSRKICRGQSPLRPQRILKNPLQEINKSLLLWLAIIFILFITAKIETDRGLVYMAVPLCIFSGHALSTFRRKEIIAAILLITAVIGIYSLNNLRWGIVTDDEYAALTWLKENTPPDSTVLAQFLEGHWVSGIAQRRNVADPNLIGAPAAERLQNILAAYRNESQREILEKYNVSYVLYTQRGPQVGSRLEYFPYKEAFRAGEIRVFEVE